MRAQERTAVAGHSGDTAAIRSYSATCLRLTLLMLAKDSLSGRAEVRHTVRSCHLQRTCWWLQLHRPIWSEFSPFAACWLLDAATECPRHWRCEHFWSWTSIFSEHGFRFQQCLHLLCFGLSLLTTDFTESAYWLWDTYEYFCNERTELCSFSGVALAFIVRTAHAFSMSRILIFCLLIH